MFKGLLMRRQKIQIYVEVLDGLATRITCKANLSYGLLKPILKDLMEKALVEERKLKKI